MNKSNILTRREFLQRGVILAATLVGLVWSNLAFCETPEQKTTVARIRWLSSELMKKVPKDWGVSYTGGTFRPIQNEGTGYQILMVRTIPRAEEPKSGSNGTVTLWLMPADFVAGKRDAIAENLVARDLGTWRQFRVFILMNGEWPKCEEDVRAALKATDEPKPEQK